MPLLTIQRTTFWIGISLLPRRGGGLAHDTKLLSACLCGDRPWEQNECDKTYKVDTLVGWPGMSALAVCLPLFLGIQLL